MQAGQWSSSRRPVSQIPLIERRPTIAGRRELKTSEINARGRTPLKLKYPTNRRKVLPSRIDAEHILVSFPKDSGLD